jgi:hypothetical protein
MTGKCPGLRTRKAQDRTRKGCRLESFWKFQDNEI